MKLQKNQTLLMIGDSITDCERARPRGEGLFGGIGKGYVAQVDALLNTVYPQLQIRVINMGSSGNTIRDLKTRWQTDVLDLKPDWLSIMIGINDVWRQHDLPLMKEQHVYLDEYESTLDTLVAQTLPTVKGLVLMTPYFMETNPKDAMRANMDKYGQAVKKTAQRYNTLFVDTQAAMNQVLAHYYPATLGWDRVHPNHIGHMTLARAFLNAVDFSWDGK